MHADGAGRNNRLIQGLRPDLQLSIVRIDVTVVGWPGLYQKEFGFLWLLHDFAATPLNLREPPGNVSF